MKKTLWALMALAMIGTAQAQQEMEDLTSKASDGSDIFVKNSSGNCVLVKANRGYRNCTNKAPEPPPTVTPPPPVQVVNETVELGAEALFDFDKYNLKPRGKEILGNLVQDLNQPGAHVEGINVVGHTDSIGTDRYNQKLSERRANSVVKFLTGAGVSPSIIQSHGEGERNPVASNKTPEGRQQNRRVEVSVKGYLEKQQQVAAPAGAAPMPQGAPQGGMAPQGAPAEGGPAPEQLQQ